jgi:hypothetical protein
MHVSYPGAFCPGCSISRVTRPPFLTVGLQDLVDVPGILVVVPDTFWVDHHVGAELAAVETARGVAANVLDAHLTRLLAHIAAQLLAASGAAAAAWVAFGAYVGAQEDVALVEQRRVGGGVCHQGSPEIVWPAELRESAPPKGFVGFAERIRLGDADIPEEVAVVAFGQFAKRPALAGACEPATGCREHSGKYGFKPLSRMECGTQRNPAVGGWQPASNLAGHLGSSDLGAEPGRSPIGRSRINRSGKVPPAKHRFSGLPEFYS